jgi:deoxyribodipyrimidine photo-lyase
MFTTNYQTIVAQLQNINPIKYNKTRNYLNGAVTQLSPYISRGVITLQQVIDVVKQKYTFYEAEKLVQELAWRAYWQQQWHYYGNKVLTDILNPQQRVQGKGVPIAITTASTGIQALDAGINNLYNTGYMHNHIRMYIAAVTCNIGQAPWLPAAYWLYYNLLDGDVASNFLSWQWVAGTNSNKLYYCNQENINRFCNTTQKNTFLDYSYEQLPLNKLPNILYQQQQTELTTPLPTTSTPTINTALPTLVYNSYNLNPTWRSGQAANKILLLEPNHFNAFPVAQKVIDFILALAKNIPDIQIFVGNFSELKALTAGSEIIYLQHPTTNHYKGTADADIINFPKFEGSFRSFFQYWKKAEKLVKW